MGAEPARGRLGFSFREAMRASRGGEDTARLIVGFDGAPLTGSLQLPDRLTLVLPIRSLAMRRRACQGGLPGIRLSSRLFDTLPRL
jgi:hypothetical protein